MSTVGEEERNNSSVIWRIRNRIDKLYDDKIYKLDNMAKFCFCIVYSHSICFTKH